MLFNTRMRTSEQSKPFGGSFSHHLWLPLLRLLHESCIPVSSLSAHLTSSGPVADTTSMVTTILEDKVTSDATFEPTGAQGIDPRKCLVLSDHLDNFFGLGLPWFQASKASYARSAPPPPPPLGLETLTWEAEANSGKSLLDPMRMQGGNPCLSWADLPFCTKIFTSW